MTVAKEMGAADENLRASLSHLRKNGGKILFLGYTARIPEAIELLKKQCLPLIRHLKDDFQLLQTRKTVQDQSDSDSGSPFDSMKEALMKALAALEKKDMDATENEMNVVFMTVAKEIRGTADENLQAALKHLRKNAGKILMLGYTGRIPEAIELLKNQCLPLIRHLKDDFQLLETRKTMQKQSDSDSGSPFDSMKEALMKALAALEKEDMDATE